MTKKELLLISVLLEKASETFSNFGASLESASSKVAKGKSFDLSAAEKIAWEKTKVDLAEVTTGLNKLSDKAIAEKMLDRKWVADTAAKARQQAELFDMAAQRSNDLRLVAQAKAKREHMLDLAESLEENLRSGGRPNNSRKLQGPKTRAAKKEEGLFKIDLTGMGSNYP